MLRMVYVPAASFRTDTAGVYFKLALGAEITTRARFVLRHGSARGPAGRTGFAQSSASALRSPVYKRADGLVLD